MTDRRAAERQRRSEVAVPERERTQRNALRLPVTVWQRGEGGQRTSGHLMNVSGGGAYIATYEPLPPGTPVVVEVELPDRAVRLSAQIVHDESQERAQEHTMFRAGMGIRFDLPDDPEVTKLARLGQPLKDSGGRRQNPR